MSHSFLSGSLPPASAMKSKPPHMTVANRFSSITNCAQHKQLSVLHVQHDFKHDPLQHLFVECSNMLQIVELAETVAAHACIMYWFLGSSSAQ